MNPIKRRVSQALLTGLLALLMQNSAAIDSDDCCDKKDAAHLIAMQARREALKMLFFADYINNDDLESACQLAELTLKSDTILLDTDDNVDLSQEDKQSNKIMLDRINNFFSNGYCLKRKPVGSDSE